MLLTVRESCWCLELSKEVDEIFPALVNGDFLCGELLVDIATGDDRVFITSFLYGKSENGVPSIENV